MKKSIGVNVKPPEKQCQDSKCAWHGQLSVRGKTLQGIVKSTKSAKTAVIESHYTRFIPKYDAYERRKIRVSAHNPDCIRAREGHEVVIAECRQLAKTKSFVVVGFAQTGAQK